MIKRVMFQLLQELKFKFLTLVKRHQTSMPNRVYYNRREKESVQLCIIIYIYIILYIYIYSSANALQIIKPVI